MVSRISFALVLMLAACTPGQVRYPAPHEEDFASKPETEASDHVGDTDELIWVALDVSGGRQCVSSDNYRPPRTRTMLSEAGIEVYETARLRLLVCEACSCPFLCGRALRPNPQISTGGS